MEDEEYYKKNIENLIREGIKTSIDKDKDSWIWEKLRIGDNQSINEARDVLLPYTLVWFRKNFLKDVDLSLKRRKDFFYMFFPSKNLEIVTQILKRMVKEIKIAEKERIEKRRRLYERIGHPYNIADLSSPDMDLIEIVGNINPSALKRLFGEIHSNYYRYYVRFIEKNPLRVFPRFRNLYMGTIKANFKRLKKEWLDTFKSKGKVPMGIEEAKDYLIKKGRGIIDRYYKNEIESTSPLKEKKNKKSGIYQIGDTKYYSLPYIAEKYDIPQRTLYYWVKKGAIPITSPYIEGVGKIKLISKFNLINVKRKKMQKENYRKVLESIVKERKIKLDSARQVICRLRKRQKLHLRITENQIPKEKI